MQRAWVFCHFVLCRPAPGFSKPLPLSAAVALVRMINLQKRANFLRTNLAHLREPAITKRAIVAALFFER